MKRKIVTSIILILFGVGFCVWGWILIADARLSTSWPTALATIEYSAIKSYDSRSDGKTTRMYSADIRYWYTVNGKQYTSARISFGDHSSSSSTGMEKLVNKYSKGSQATAYYDPGKPGNALLEPGPVLISYIPFVFGALSIVAALIAIFKKKGTSMPPPGSRRSGLRLLSLIH